MCILVGFDCAVAKKKITPEAIVLFGGLARAKEFLLGPIEEAMNGNVLPLWKNKVKIVFSQLKESDAAILGASALAWEL